MDVCADIEEARLLDTSGWDEGATLEAIVDARILVYGKGNGWWEE
jgi:hypothetical protein